MSWIAVAAIGGAAVTGYFNNEAAETAAEATPQFNPLIQQSLERILPGIIRGSDDFAIFGGDRTADFSDEQLAAIGLTPGIQDALTAQQAQTAAGFEQFTAPPGQNPFLEESIARMRDVAFTDLARNQLPGIRNTAVAEGGIGGSRQGIAEGLALSDLNRDLLTAESGLRRDQLNQDLSNQLQALINQGNILSGQTAAQDLLLRIGALQQGQEQAEIQGDIQATADLNLPFQQELSLLQTLLGSPAAVPPIPNQTNPLAAGLGTALAVDQLTSDRSNQTTQTQQTGGTGATNTNNPSTSFFSNPLFFT